MVGLALLFVAVLSADRGAAAFVSGGVYGAVFIGVLMEWIGNLADEAIFALLVSQVGFYAVGAWVLWRFRDAPMAHLSMISIGAWTLMEFARERLPFGGLNWGAPGYALGEWAPLRASAQWIGTSGLGVLATALALGVALAVARRSLKPLVWASGTLIALAIGGAMFPSLPQGEEITVAIVQGNSPCPGSSCTNERQLIFESHLSLTQTLPADTYDLVVWAESSTGFGFDPLQSSGVAVALSDEARRLGSYLIIGGDRADTPDAFVNSNLVYDRDGGLIGEYRKRHPVPFGEYVPFRSILGDLALLQQIPRDMVRGSVPGVFDFDFGSVGTVISYEAGFARYSRDSGRAGAQLMVVASNEASYGRSAASEQFIAMSRMRAAENGLDIVHSAITGSSALITSGGEVGETTELYEAAIVSGTVTLREGPPTLFARWGDWLAVVAMLGASLSVAMQILRDRVQNRGEVTQRVTSPTG